MLDENGSNPVAAELLVAARKLRPVLAERAEKTDRDRRLPDDTITELTNAGLFRVTGHKRRGGHGLTALESIEITAELAKGCTSTAFVQALLDGSRGVVVAMLDDEGVDEVFSTSDDPLITGILAPGGMAVPVDGGFLVNGRWSYATGCWHAGWTMGGVLVADADGNVVDGGTIYAPMSELTIEDTWHVAGMRGTGSATVVASDVFVPKRRISLQSRRRWSWWPAAWTSAASPTSRSRSRATRTWCWSRSVRRRCASTPRGCTPGGRPRSWRTRR
jgi:alkylation response protein AidB-like acyl-CoA dehydrogenase